MITGQDNQFRKSRKNYWVRLFKDFRYRAPFYNLVMPNYFQTNILKTNLLRNDDTVALLHVYGDAADPQLDLSLHQVHQHGLMAAHTGGHPRIVIHPEVSTNNESSFMRLLFQESKRF